jgi:hypothetical protein
MSEGREVVPRPVATAGPTAGRNPSRHRLNHDRQVFHQARLDWTSGASGGFSRECSLIDKRHQDAVIKSLSQRHCLRTGRLNVIIVSESSAEATQPTSTGRYAPAAQRHTTTHRGARTYGQSAFTQKRSSRCRSTTPCLRWADSGAGHGWAPAWWDTGRVMFRAFGDLPSVVGWFWPDGRRRLVLLRGCGGRHCAHLVGPSRPAWVEGTF